MGISVAVIGAGRNGMCFIEEYNKHPAVDTIFVADPFPKTKENIKELKKVKKVYDSGIELLENEKIDLTSIHTPAHLHTEFFTKACEIGTHIFVEKPLATTLDDIRTILKAAKNNHDRKIAVGHNYRLMSYHTEIKKLIDNGELGEIICIRTGYISDYIYYWQTEPNGRFINKKGELNIIKPIFEGATHSIDLANWFIGSGAKSAYGLRKEFQAGKVNADWIATIFGYPNDIIVHLDASFGMIAPHKPSFGLEIYGTKGTIRDNVFWKYGSQEYHLRNFVSKPLVVDESSHKFDEEVKNIISAIVEGKDVLVSLEEGAQAVIAAIFAEKSALIGKVLYIPKLNELWNLQ